MNPKDCKGKRVTHTQTNQTFIAAGGGRKADVWYLKDAQGIVYLFDECQPTSYGDVRAIKSFTELNQLVDFHASVGSERFNEAWTELEKDPVEAAAVAFLYCDDWKSFEGLTEGYEVSQEINPELNAQFKALLVKKGLADRVRCYWQQSLKSAVVL